MNVANENRQMFETPESQKADLEVFVSNCGNLLSQTREGIVSVQLLDMNTCVIHFKGGATKPVNISCCSYLATLQEIIKAIQGGAY